MSPTEIDGFKKRAGKECQERQKSMALKYKFIATHLREDAIYVLDAGTIGDDWYEV